jgi:hypothetical protein
MEINLEVRNQKLDVGQPLREGMSSICSVQTSNLLCFARLRFPRNEKPMSKTGAPCQFAGNPE